MNNTDNTMNSTMKEMTITQLNDLYEQSIHIKPNRLRNQIQEKIRDLISKLSDNPV